MQLSGKVALVTGGSGDIGRGIAERLGAAGAYIVVTYVGAEDAAQATVDAIVGAGGSASKHQLDQREPAAIDACIVAVESQFQRLDILINNAA